MIVEYCDEMNRLINSYYSRDTLEEIITSRLNKSFNKYLEEIEEEFEEASANKRIQVLRALRKGLENER